MAENEREKPKDWEPQYTQVPIASLQQIIQDVVNATLSGGGVDASAVQSSTGGISTSNVEVVLLLNNIKGMIMALTASVQALVDQVAATKSYEDASKAAMALLVTQSKALSDQVATLTAAGTGMSAADAAAVTQATADLHASAVALEVAVPANVAPAPVAAAPVVDPAAPAAPAAPAV